MIEPVYARSPDVVWRLGPDRVLVQFVSTDLQAQDLRGVAAFVWVSLDEPGTMSQVTERLIESGIVSNPEEAIELLVAGNLVVANEHE